MKKCIWSKKTITTFIVLFFLTNMVFALSVLEELEAKKREEMKKNKVTYIPTTSTPKLDRELAKQKKSRTRTYKIVKGRDNEYGYSFLCSPDGKTKYLTIDGKEGPERLAALNENEVLYVYQKSALIDGNDEQGSKVENPDYHLGIRIIDGHGNTVKELDIGGYLNFPLVSKDGSFFIVPENCRDIYLWKSLENALNPSYFSTGRGIIAFDGNGNKLWEDEFPKETSIDYNYFDMSKSGKYTFITFDDMDMKSIIYTRNGEKIPADRMWDGYFSKDESYFIRYSHGHDIYLYDIEAKDKIYVGAGMAPGALVAVSGKEAGIAAATRDGILYITDTKKRIKIATIDYNNDYYKRLNNAHSEEKELIPAEWTRALYISQDGTEILIKADNNGRYMFKRVKK